ncbi:MAG TPA: Hpt domain-containing protein [Pirellula sp.]|nr:Hpt domain-containing protein [Pirellula sp.]
MDGIFDLAGALERVEGDREFLCELAKIYLDEVSKLMIAIAADVEQNDIITAARRAHTIKGASSNFCARAVSDTAWEFEQLLLSSDSEHAASAYDKLRHETDRLNQALRREFAI